MATQMRKGRIFPGSAFPCQAGDFEPGAINKRLSQKHYLVVVQFGKLRVTLVETTSEFQQIQVNFGS